MSETIVRSDIFMNSPREAAENIGPGLHRTLLGYDDHLMLAKVWFDKGAIGERHSHPHSQVAYVVEGQFEVYIDGKTEICLVRLAATFSAWRSGDETQRLKMVGCESGRLSDCHKLH